jgi:hypothetical protein
MKHVTIVFLLSLVSAFHASADQSEYDDCILKYLSNAKLDVAAHLIKQACDENFRTPGINAKKRRAYNDCLLEHLVGIESLQATMDIKAACSSKYE